MATSTKENETKPTPTQPGFGGLSQWEAIEKHGITDPSQIGVLDEQTREREESLYSGVQGALTGMEDSIKRLSEANASMLKGEIPADVSASVRRAASESSIAGGVFGSASRALSARDLGRTSADIKQQGIQNEASIAEAKNSLASSYESIRQYNLNRNAAIAELSLKAKQQNLSAIEQERMRIATNIESNISILGQIAQLSIQQQSIAASAAANRIDPGNIISSLDNVIAQFTSHLS